jgi:RNA polymerase sigma-70 factor (ECF subfamily)
MPNLEDKSPAEGPQWTNVDQRFRAPLMAYFYRRVGDRRDAEDLTQEVFIRLTRHPDKPSGEGAEAYVFMIASNLLKDRTRHQLSRRTTAHRSLSDLPQTITTPQPLVEERDPERVFAAKETLQDVVAALGEMSERTREVFILSRLENMHHRDIAAMYGISVSAVEKHVMRALGVLTARFLA